MPNAFASAIAPARTIVRLCWPGVRPVVRAGPPDVLLVTGEYSAPMFSQCGSRVLARTRKCQSMANEPGNWGRAENICSF